ncbi:MAG: sensor histidine kinase, partial [Syntrophothermus sp.]
LKQFAYVASHDLQEPLRMISSYLAMLEKKYDTELDEKARQFIGFAVDGSKRMSNLIKDLLSYSRITTQANELTSVDLNNTFSDVTLDLQILIKEKGAKISSAKLPVIKGDPIQMHQLLQNIIGNAIKFQGKRPPEVIISANEIEKGWLFSVKDNGIGIDPQFYDRIFQLFQRLHEQGKYPGTGIGLAVCKKIVERHGGRIWVESEVGQGTTFYFTISEFKPAE